MPLDFSTAPLAAPDTQQPHGFRDVAQALLSRSRDACRYLLPGGVQRGPEFVAGDVQGSRGDSLSVNLATGIWKDFAGGQSGGDLVSLWAARHGLSQAEARDEAAQWLGMAGGPQRRSQSPQRATTGHAPQPAAAVPQPAPADLDPDWWRGAKATARWDYVSADGTAFGSVYRFDHPTAKRPNGKPVKVIRPWNPNTCQWEAPSGARPILHLPRVVDPSPADERALPGVIVLVEGEGKCDRLRALGVNATTIWGGSQAAAATDWSWARGRHIVIWPDKDQAGHEFTQAALHYLQANQAATVRAVSPPGDKPEKWDAADATDAEASGLLGAAVGSQPMHTGPDAVDWERFRLDRLAAGTPPPIEWLVQNVMPLGKPGLVIGPGGVGKSLAVMDLCIKVATRHKAGIVDPAWMLGPIPASAAGMAIFLTGEDDTAEVHRRANALCPPQGGVTYSMDPARNKPGESPLAGAPLYVLPWLDMPGFDPTLIRQDKSSAALTHFATEGLDALIARYERASGQPLRILALDPAGDLLSGDENDNALVKPLMAKLREIASRHNCVVLLIGHTPKGVMDEDNITMRGAGAFIANTRFTIGMWRPERSDTYAVLKGAGLPRTAAGRVVFAKVVKANHPNPPSNVFQLVQDERTGLPVDFTGAVREGYQEQNDDAVSAFADLVRRAVGVGMPLARSTAARAEFKRLDPVLANVSEKRMREIVNKALERGVVVASKVTGRGRAEWLDVPGGPLAKGSDTTGLGYDWREGSLAEALGIDGDDAKGDGQ